MLFLCTRQRRTEAYFLFSTYCSSVFSTISCLQAKQLLLFLCAPFPDRCLLRFSTDFLKILVNKEPQNYFYSPTSSTCLFWVNPVRNCLYLKAYKHPEAVIDLSQMYVLNPAPWALDWDLMYYCSWRKYLIWEKPWHRKRGIQGIVLVLT